MKRELPVRTLLDPRISRFLNERVSDRPRIGIILGSGLGDFVDRLENRSSFPTAAIPGYPKSTIAGHVGNLVLGTIGSIRVLAFQGRIHYYENPDLDRAMVPVRVAAALGIRHLIVTNAAGGVNRTFAPGDLMLITDQLNMSFLSPAGGEKGSATPRRFMGRDGRHPYYAGALTNIIRKTARAAKISLQEGVYCGLQGPSYETAAEIRMLARLGVDAVGMSTVNEVALARSLGIGVAGVSCITNLSTGISASKLSHADVTEVADTVKLKFCELLVGSIHELARSGRG